MKTKDAGMTGRDHYRSIYQQTLEAEAEWLRAGAAGKADSIGFFLRERNIRPESLLELGCGTGALITECQRRDYAQRYSSVDYSPEAISYLSSHSPGIQSLAADITSDDFAPAESYDVVILSHVLEHLEDPGAFLRSVQRINFSWLVLEVPLEDLFFSRVKSLLRDRTQNLAGHVQFYTAASFDQLVTGSGLEILGRRTYVPVQGRDDLRFVCTKNGAGRLKYLQTLLTGRYLPLATRPLWARLYYAHYAVLCRRASDARAVQGRVMPGH